MAKRMPRHPLERWAELFENSDTINQLFTTTIVPKTTDPKGRDTDSARNLGHAAALTFANTLLEGRGQILRVSDTIYDDVLASKFEQNVHQDTIYDHMPWNMFAIELKGNARWQAVIVTTVGTVLEELSTAMKRFHLEDMTDKYANELITTAIEHANETNFPYGQAELGKLAVIAPVITQAYANEQMEFVIDDAMSDRVAQRVDPGMEKLLNEFERQGVPVDRDAFAAGPTREQLRTTFSPIPFDFNWTRKGNGTKFTTPNNLANLITFVLSQNTVRHTIYKPSTNARNNPKKKRSKATVHEVDFQWTDSYKTYRSAVKANKLGGHVRKHVRRGHWHRFRTGPRDAAEPTYVTYWLPPMLVGSHGESANTGHVIR